ncbi:MAG: hypothetical protein ISR65_15530 [Bacteriovoracaceae bacterium]|nr:hypothetical protein [Bacteriovoracaceae bacterium]
MSTPNPKKVNFIKSVINNLENNGFPQKRVSLPLEKMYEIAENKGLNLNQVLETLETDHSIVSEKTDDRIIFTQQLANDIDPNKKEDLMKQAMEMMNKMSPEELQRIQETFENMTPEEKQEIMRQGKDMGLI